MNSKAGKTGPLETIKSTFRILQEPIPTNQMFLFQTVDVRSPLQEYNRGLLPHLFVFLYRGLFKNALGKNRNNAPILEAA